MNVKVMNSKQEWAQKTNQTRIHTIKYYEQLNTNI